MPRPRKQGSSPNLSHGQASYVLDRMVSERRISQGEIIRYVNEMQREIDELEKRLQSLRAAAGGGGGYAGGGGGAAAPRRRGRPPGSRNRAKAAGAAAASAEGGGAKRGRRGRRARANITPEQLASRQLQGRYLGLIRQIPASKRGQYQKIAKDKGREAAIKEMAGALGK